MDIQVNVRHKEMALHEGLCRAWLFVTFLEELTRNRAPEKITNKFSKVN